MPTLPSPDESPEPKEMPVSVREAWAEVVAAIAKLHEDHAAAVAEMAFERAAELRARAEALKEKKSAILKEWPHAEKSPLLE